MSSPQRLFSVGVHDAWARAECRSSVWAECVAAGVGAAAVFYRARLQGQRPGLGADRRTDSSWYSVWGPFGDLHSVESIGIAMEYPLNRPTIELRNVHLATKDEGRSSWRRRRCWTASSNGRWRIGRERSRVRSS